MKKNFITLSVLAVTMCASNVMVGMEMEGENLNEQLIEAAKLGYLACVQDLITRGADVNFKDRCDWTPLHLAINRTRKAVVTELIKQGADVNVKDRDGTTPLHLAGIDGHKDVAIELIDAGAHVNTKNKYGFTPLHSVARQGRSDVMIELVRRGADPYIKNNSGKTPLCFIKYDFCKTMQIEDARREFEREQRELWGRLITFGASLKEIDIPHDMIGEVLEKSAEIWGVKKIVEISGKESVFAPSSLSSFAGHSKATPDREE